MHEPAEFEPAAPKALMTSLRTLLIRWLTRLSPVARAALLIFVISFGIRLVCVQQAQYVPISDARHYERRADIILSTGSMPPTAVRTPGYPYLLAGVKYAFGNGWRAIAVSNCLLGALASALLVLLAASCVGVRAAVLAGSLHAIALPALALIPQPLSENLAVPLLLAGLFCLAWADSLAGRRRLLVMAASGLFYGLLLLTRPAGLFLLPPWLLLAMYSLKNRTWRLPAGGVFVAVTAMVVAPWLARNYQLGLGPFMLSSVGGSNLYIGNNDDAVSDGSMKVDIDWDELTRRIGEAEADRYGRNRALEWIAGHPVRYLQLSGVRGLGLLATKPSTYTTRSFAHWYMAPEAFEVYKKPGRRSKKFRRWRKHYLKRQSQAYSAVAWWYALLAPFILIGSALSLPRWKHYAVVLLPAAIYIAALTFSFSQPRFRELSDPLLFVFAAALVSDILFKTEELGARPKRRTKAILVSIGLLAMIALQGTGTIKSWYKLDPMVKVEG